jgi:Ras-related protein Rab-2A
VANKVDLADSRVVSREEGEKYAKEHEFLYVESSALTGENVEEAYVDLCITILKEGNARAKDANNNT